MPVPFIAHSAQISTFTYKFLHMVSFKKGETVIFLNPVNNVLVVLLGSQWCEYGAPWRTKVCLGPEKGSKGCASVHFVPVTLNAEDKHRPWSLAAESISGVGKKINKQKTKPWTICGVKCLRNGSPKNEKTRTICVHKSHFCYCTILLSRVEERKWCRMWPRVSQSSAPRGCFAPVHIII